MNKGQTLAEYRDVLNTIHSIEHMYNKLAKDIIEYETKSLREHAADLRDQLALGVFEESV